MKSRLNFPTVAPDALQAMLALSDHVSNSGLEHSLGELVKIRASQINGCANCLHMHTKDARAAGEIEERLYLLPAWRESPLYSPRERAALAWMEALTRLPETQAPDEDYEELQQHFTDKEIADLTMLIGTINIWNRLAVGFRVVHPTKPAVAAVAAQG